MNSRPFITIALVLSIIFFPYWIYLPAILAALIFYPLYWEALFLAFFIDVLHGRGATLFSPLAIVMLICTLLLLPVRERLRFNV